jgi:hypothetical protein
MQIEETGPTDIFTGAMASVITRRVKRIQVMVACTFTTLTFMYPSGEAQATSATAPTYPPLAEIRDVKTFRLATGTVLVTFYADKGN